MTKFHRVCENNRILYYGENIGVGEEITEDFYNKLNQICEQKPANTATHYYILNAETLEFEAIERDEPIELPTPTYTLDEAAAIIASEVAGNE